MVRRETLACTKYIMQVVTLDIVRHGILILSSGRYVRLNLLLEERSHFFLV
jgi:hypothetical protein